MKLAPLVAPALDDLYPIEVGVFGVLSGTDQEARCATPWRRRQIAAHGHTTGVSDGRECRAFGVIIRVVPTAEESDGNSGPGGPIHFLALQCSKNSLTRILACPDCGISCRTEHAHGIGAKWAGFIRTHLAPEVVLIGRGEARVGISAPDHAELEGVGTEFCLVRKAQLERGAGIGLVHVVGGVGHGIGAGFCGRAFLGRGLLARSFGCLARALCRRLAGSLCRLLTCALRGILARCLPHFLWSRWYLAKALVVGEFIIRRDERVSFAITLNLGDLKEWFDGSARPGIPCIDRLVLERQRIEHLPNAQVTVVGNRHHVAAHAGLVLF